jgi:hypothetical protein
MWGGLLLGWAREGQILDHDCRDADFAFLADDRDRFLRSVHQLVEAGFHPAARWSNNDDHVTEYTFVKDETQFDFFEMRHEGGWFWYHTYSPAAALQTTNAIPAHGLETINFLERDWLKPSDHNLHLTSVYGDWEKPRPAWDWIEDDQSIRATSRWAGSKLPMNEESHV